MRVAVIGMTAGLVGLIAHEVGTDGWAFFTFGLAIVAAAVLALEAISRYGK